MRFFTVEKIEKLLVEVRAAATRGSRDIPAFKFWQAPFDAVSPAGAEQPAFDDRAWGDFRVGETWGGYDLTAWFRTRVPIPAEWQGKKLALRFLVGPRDGGDSTAETLLYVGGRPLQAIDVWHEAAWLPPELLTSGEIAIALKAWSGVLGVPDRRRFRLAQLVWLDEGAERLAYLADTLLKTVRVLDEHDLRRGLILDALHAAFLAVDFSKPGSDGFYASIAAAAGQLGAAVRGWQGLAELKPRVVGIGHAHIDMAWLWRLAHTREKAARTFATALHLMRQYPAYRFMHSSPQLYKFLKQDYPEIFARVREQIAAGRWEITGATWVEPDTNITGGESLVRQFLFGTRWAQREFGVTMHLLWLPDVFGYSAALPQIIAKSGIRYFLTSKISWSQFNRFPHDTFRWRGLDGTEVLTHFVTTPEDGSAAFTYNAQMRPADVKGAWDNYRQRDVNDELLMLFGWGDGGGGPTQEMLESATAMANLPGLPAVELGRAEPFFERLAARVADRELPVWDGELYLEYHRGAYTSQAQIKRANRRAEILYHNAEWLSALADVLTGEQAYPAEELNAGWELLLLNQFHDILPGSSIRPVYEDAARDDERITDIGQRAVAQAQGAILECLSTSHAERVNHSNSVMASVQRSISAAEVSQQRSAASLVVFNPLSWPRDGLVEISVAQAASLRDDALERVQVVEEGGEKKLLVAVNDAPALGYAVLTPRPPLLTANSSRQERGSTGGEVAPPSAETWFSSQERGERGVRTPFYRLTLNAHGQIISLYDKRHAREVLAPGGRGNVLQAFEDKPLKFDAWDIDIYYGEKLAEVTDLVESVVEEAGPLRGSLRLTWRFRDSVITQRLTLYADSPRIDFRTEVDWHERQTLLKVAFPVAIRAARATYDVQFGAVERPTHWNTSWDWARFEVPAQKWADLSEGDYGVALLNDCKYGYDIHDHVLRLTLIKSAIRPDAQADQGRHVFTYSLLPHAGDWRQGDVAREAYALNYPLLAVPSDGMAVNSEQEHPERRPRSLWPESKDAASRITAAHPLATVGQPLPTSALGASRFSFASVDAGHVIIETVKRAEDDPDAWIIRLYEYQQSRRQGVRLTLCRPVQRAVECNLVEQAEQPVAFDADGVIFDILPFEIKTFKVWFT